MTAASGEGLGGSAGCCWLRRKGRGRVRFGCIERENREQREEKSEFLFSLRTPSRFSHAIHSKKKKGKRLVREFPACSSSLYSWSLSRQISRVRLVDSQ